MTERPKHPRDLNLLAKSVVDIATNNCTDSPQPNFEAQKKGGRRGGVARARALSPGVRSEIARKAAASRWMKDDS